MSDKNVTTTKDTSSLITTNSSSPTRAKSFKITTSSNYDYMQYKRTVDAYMQAGLPFEHIATAGDIRGDKVEKNEVDAPLQEGWQNKTGETASDDNKMIAWQSRGEKVVESHQLAASVPVTGKELIITSNQLTISQPTEDRILEVIEGIAVVKEDPSKLSGLSADQKKLEDNPFLKAIPEEIEKVS